MELDGMFCKIKYIITLLSLIAIPAFADYQPFEPPQTTAFGEQSVSILSPIIQVQFPYNINTDIIETRENAGTVSIVNNKANLSTGGTTTATATLLTRTPVKYNPGQGGLIRFTALYTTGTANSSQWVGIGDTNDGYFFGYNGTAFGILRRQGGKPEVRKLEITTKSTTAEDITLTLNGSTVAVTVTDASSGDLTTTANDIAAGDFSDTGEGWEVHAMGENVFFNSYSDGAKSGLYEITTATTTAGTFTRPLTGVSTTETIVNQTAWSEDRFLFSTDPDNSAAGVTLDPTKGNVYQIRYQWLGFGLISFYIEDPSDGEYHLVHKIEYANANTVPSVDNPTLPLFAQAKNTTNSTDVVIEIGSMAGFVEGIDDPKGLPHSLSLEVGSVGTSETPIFTIHSHDIYQSTVNRVKVKMIQGSVSVDGTKPATIRVRKNAITTAGTFTAFDSNTSTIHQDIVATAVTGGIIIFSDTVAKDGRVMIDFEKFGIELVPPDFLTLSVEASAGTTDTVSTFNWQENF